MDVRLIQRDNRKALAVTHIVQKMLSSAIQGQPLNCLVDKLGMAKQPGMEKGQKMSVPSPLALRYDFLTCQVNQFCL